MIEIVTKNHDEKLVRISVEFNESIIADIHISGDFFIYPEYAIDIIENALRGIVADTTLIQQTLHKVITSNNIELVGISVATIVQGIMEAARQ